MAQRGSSGSPGPASLPVSAKLGFDPSSTAKAHLLLTSGSVDMNISFHPNALFISTRILFSLELSDLRDDPGLEKKRKKSFLKCFPKPNYDPESSRGTSLLHYSQTSTQSHSPQQAVNLQANVSTSEQRSFPDPGWILAKGWISAQASCSMLSLEGACWMGGIFQRDLDEPRAISPLSSSSLRGTSSLG